jgi:predicted GH43/DUF377 family glycosyl hydrolase
MKRRGYMALRIPNDTAIAAGLALFAAQTLAGKEDVPDWQMGPFVKCDQPVLSPTPESKFKCPILGTEVKFEEQNTYSPATVVREGKVYLFYRADTASWNWPPEKGRPWNAGPTCRLAMANSEDGRHFTRWPQPVLYPDDDFLKQYEWPAGLWDPRLIEDEQGTYYLYYNTWNGWNYYRLCVATSKDLIHWEKKGSVFGDASAISGCVVWRQMGHRKVAARIQGKYWMYYDHNLLVATSDDLIKWTPIHKSLRDKVDRAGHYDIGSAEPGTAMLTGERLLLMINGLNGDPPGDRAFPTNMWSIGQMLVNPMDPARGSKWAPKPFIFPEHKWEKEGFTQNCTVMHDGMVYFQNKWLLYYGGGDKHIGLAIYDPRARR